MLFVDFSQFPCLIRIRTPNLIRIHNTDIMIDFDSTLSITASSIPELFWLVSSGSEICNFLIQLWIRDRSDSSDTLENSCCRICPFFPSLIAASKRLYLFSISPLSFGTIRTSFILLSAVKSTVPSWCVAAHNIVRCTRVPILCPGIYSYLTIPTRERKTGQEKEYNY